jgi:solute carrier family 25 protein 39/40
MKIVQTEGITALWRGLPPTLVMAIPATVIYFVGYESIKTVLEDKTSMIYTPLMAGGFARSKFVIVQRMNMIVYLIIMMA